MIVLVVVTIRMFVEGTVLRVMGAVRIDNFEPTVKVDLYPQDDAFDALIKRLQSNNRTYELFEIAHSYSRNQSDLLLLFLQL